MESAVLTATNQTGDWENVLSEAWGLRFILDKEKQTVDTIASWGR
jgi:hypothetical protein